MDVQKINDSLFHVEEDVSYIDKLLSDTVKSYCSELDDVMERVYEDVIKVEYPAIMTIEKYFTELSGVLYNMCEKVERLGVYDSISKSKAQNTYNIKYLEVSNPTQGKKPTVGETQALSDNAALYDKTVNDMYSKAYKIVKNKVEAAETMVSTLSKIFSHRIQESNMVSNQMGRKILNEGNNF